MKLTLTANNISSRDINIIMIFFRLRNNPQIPTKKRVKDTPKILNKLIGIFSLFYASFGDVYPLVCSSNWMATMLLSGRIT